MADKSIIEELEAQVGGLISDHQRLGALVKDLKSQNDKLLQDRRELREQVSTLNGELSSLRLSQALSGSGGVDKDKSRARVNHLMREVDKCIALLNSVEERE